jgi:hypothetical protein
MFIHCLKRFDLAHIIKDFRRVNMDQNNQKTNPWIITQVVSVVIIAILATLVFVKSAKIPAQTDCIDEMEFIKDLNYDDEDFTAYPKIDPGEAFQKGFRIKNTGTCTWTNAYFIEYVYGNTTSSRMQGDSTSVKGKVDPGQNYDIYINLVAPKTAGKYVGYWQIFNGDNDSFGPSFWVAVQVRSTQPGAHTATATVTVDATLTPTHNLVPTATATPEPTATDFVPTTTTTPGSTATEGTP